MNNFGFRRRLTAELLLATFAFIAAPALPGGGPAFAHATLIGSSPAQNAILAAPPREIRLRFNARIEGRVTQMSLRRSDGMEVPVKMSQSGKGNELVVALPALAPGVYALRYKVMATDSHITEDLIRFTVLKR